jgi:hypothetical protein
LRKAAKPEATARVFPAAAPRRPVYQQTQEHYGRPENYGAMEIAFRPSGGSMLPKYIQELGDNAYSAFNAITGFASHPPENRCVYWDHHSYQQRAGAWLIRVYDECRQKDFSLSDYLIKLAGGDEKKN